MTFSDRHLIFTLVTLSLGLGPSIGLGADKDSTRISGSLRAGPEYDSNPYRFFKTDSRRDKPPSERLPAITGDPLFRYFGTLDVSHLPGESSQGTLNIQHGGKQFLEARAASTFLTRLQGNFKHRFAERWILQADLHVKDRTEHTSRLDYNTGSATTGVIRDFDRWQLSLDGGWQYFIHKPNAHLSSHGPTAMLAGHYFPTKSLTLGSYYQMLGRRFTEISLLGANDGQPLPNDRQDRLHNLAVTAKYQHTAQYRVQYRFARNTSTDEEAEFTEHRINFGSTFPIAWGLLGTVETDMRFGDVSILNPTQRTDEDNNHSVTLSLAKPIGEFEVEGRYSHYTSSLQLPEADYQRSTYYLNVATYFGD